MKFLKKINSYLTIRKLKNQLDNVEETLSSLEHHAFVAEHDDTQPWDELKASHQALLSKKQEIELLIKSQKQ